MKTSRKMILATLGCVLAAGGAFAAESRPAMETTSVRVSYGDLDLSRAEGASMLYGRLKDAARKVCGHSYYRDLVPFVNTKKCYTRALEDAVLTVEKQSLVTLHRAKTTTSREA
jgi:UrcA family protein